MSFYGVTLNAEMKIACFVNNGPEHPAEYATEEEAHAAFKGYTSYKDGHIRVIEIKEAEHGKV